LKQMQEVSNQHEKGFEAAPSALDACEQRAHIAEAELVRKASEVDRIREESLEVAMAASQRAEAAENELTMIQRQRSPDATCETTSKVAELTRERDEATSKLAELTRERDEVRRSLEATESRTSATETVADDVGSCSAPDIVLVAQVGKESDRHDPGALLSHIEKVARRTLLLVSDVTLLLVADLTGLEVDVLQVRFGELQGEMQTVFQDMIETNVSVSEFVEDWTSGFNDMWRALGLQVPWDSACEFVRVAAFQTDKEAARLCNALVHHRADHLSWLPAVRNVRNEGEVDPKSLLSRCLLFAWLSIFCYVVLWRMLVRTLVGIPCRLVRCVCCYRRIGKMIEL